MSENTKGFLEFCAVLVAGVVVFSVVVGLILSIVWVRPRCIAQTADIGLPARWGFYSGCQVEIASGTWVPLERWIYIERGVGQ